VFAYTVKGWGLPTAGNPRNHSALLTGDQIEALRSVVGLDPATEWDRIDPRRRPGSGRWRAASSCAAAGARPLGVAVPKATGIRGGKPVSTQEVFGRVLVDLSRDEAVAPYLVTTAPDVATSTNLAGFINRRVCSRRTSGGRGAPTHS
jgi:pyruvate dehydrogenase E1 component